MMKERFSWLPLSDRKNISLPIVVYEHDSSKYSGYYDSSSKTICVVLDDIVDIRSTLAHEFRHHTQHELNQNTSDYSIIDYTLPYEQMISKYFSTQIHELDALLYEYKIHKTDLNDWWLNKLVKECNYA